ncbi:acyl-CoA dehydrogenase family protein [Sphingobium sp.]|uniref:acyl-CoA dehydrogenase family protein n=1 Tax=Sphingobium sp. TaxID=1912891 RepID=UPI002B94D485|nr:acyl-CoA dehydrogenase family protein [Sphingobium sp.]HUD93910.1 acyl-CoA dehydrogenase family protein [Sphingobium sp.]
MNEQQTMLADMAGSLFAELSYGATVAADWGRIEEMGFTGLLLGEEAGGFDGSWVDAGIVFRLAGYHALALPLVEAVLAARIVADAGFAGQGFGTIAERAEGRLDGDRFTGTLLGAAWGSDAGFVVAPSPLGGGMILSTEGAGIESHANIADEPRDRLHVSGARVTALPGDIFALGAAARAMQMAGALDAALALAVGYVNDRKQFGKPLGKLQAVQQTLAVFACEAAAANSAAVGVAQALDRGDAVFEVAAAKTRANIAAGLGTSIAHQAHGAIGFTHEYGLQSLTRRLWSWRSEFGGEHHWSAALGRQVVAAGADNYWAEMVRRSDPAA